MSSFSQCKGLTKQNKPCQVKWDLDANGYCKHHGWQHTGSRASSAPAASATAAAAPSPGLQTWTTPSPHCHGTTKEGKPCQIHWDLDANGYCKHHGDQYTGSHTSATPPAAAAADATTVTATVASPGQQCRGTTKQGVRCKITRDLNADNMCTHHAGQVPQCHGVGQPDGRRCAATLGIDRFGFCADHRSNEVSTDPAPTTHATSPLPLANDSDNDDADDASDHTSDASPRDGTDDEDQDESKPSVEARGLQTVGIILLFETVTRMGRDADTKVRWTIQNTSGDTVEQGMSMAGVACLLTNVSVEAAQLHLVVAVDTKKDGSITSEPHPLNALRPSGKVNISTTRSVKVHVVPLERGAAP